MDSVNEGSPASAWREHFLKIAFSTHAPGGRRTISAVEASFKGETLDADRVRAPQVSVIPEDLVKRIDAARRGVIKAIDTYTFPCRERGHRLVSKRRSGEFLRAFNAAVAEFLGVAEAAAGRYDEIMEFNRSFWRPKFDSEAEYIRHVESRLPRSAEALKKSFAVGVTWLDSQLESEFFEDEAMQRFFDKMKQNSEALERDLVVSLRSEPMSKLVAACEELKTKISSGQRIDARAFSTIQAAFALCEATCDMQDPQTAQKIRAAARKIGQCLNQAGSKVDHGTSHTAAIKGLAAVINEAIDSASSAALDDLAMAAGGVSSDMGSIQPIGYVPDEADDGGDGGHVAEVRPVPALGYAD